MKKLNYGYAWLRIMNTYKLIVNIYDIIMGIHNRILDTHYWFMDIYNYGSPWLMIWMYMLRALIRSYLTIIGLLSSVLAALPWYEAYFTNNFDSHFECDENVIYL